MDDRCHICRRPPLEQDPLYSVTTCKDCGATFEASRAVPLFDLILETQRIVMRNVLKVLAWKF